MSIKIKDLRLNILESNLTKGPILKSLIKLAIPIMASSFLATLYNITDMAWIGLLGSKAVAGVGVGGMFTWLSQGLSSIARMGGQVQVAQCIGRGDKESAHKYAQTAMQLSLYMGLLFAVFSLVFVHQMVGFFNLTDVEAYDAAISYTRIACGLIVFSFMTMTLTGVYTAQGDSKTPFLANLVGLVTNMILDPLLILGPGPLPKLGVSGAAIATVTAQFIVMSIMVLDIIWQKKENVLKGIHLIGRMSGKYLSGICKIGIWGLLITLIFIFTPTPITTIFFHEPSAIATAVSYLVIIGFSEAFLCIELTTIGAISGLGKTNLCSIISILFTSARIPLAMILGNTSMGLNGIWWAFSSTTIIKGIIFTGTFFWIIKKCPKNMNPPSSQA